jgi:hypothetical protein
VELKRGLAWARKQSWLDEKTKALLAQALAKLPALPKGAAAS